MEPTNTGTEKPTEVIRAVQLLYAAIAVGVINTTLNFGHLTSEAPAGVVLLGLIFTLGIVLFLIIKISQRRNWARITFLVLFLLGLPFAIPGYVDNFRRNALSGILAIVITILQLIAIYLLFRRSANQWFRGRKVNPDAG